jgi:GxxExxY protein
MIANDFPVHEDDFPFAEEGYELMAAAFEVYGELGGGLAEEIYQEALELELGLRGIGFVARQELSLHYKGNELKKRYIPDLFVSGGIIVEIKAVTAISSDHIAQLLNYMRISCQPVGYLINFGPTRKVEWKRFVLREFTQKS